MAKTRQLVLRLEEELADRIDAYAERLRAETGLEVKTAVVVRKLLTEALDASEMRTKKGGR